MIDLLRENWAPAAIVLAVALLLLWWLLSRRAPDRRRRYSAPDALDAGVAPAQRNQALIDAPPAAALAGLAATGPDILGGIGEVIAAAAAQEVEAAQDSGQATAAGAIAPAAQLGAEGDDLTRIKGVGPKLAAKLAELGVSSFAQIAAWDEADLTRVDGQLGSFAGRPARDQWVAQCGFLASGDVAGYEAKFGKL